MPGFDPVGSVPVATAPASAPTPPPVSTGAITVFAGPGLAIGPGGAGVAVMRVLGNVFVDQAADLLWSKP